MQVKSLDYINNLVNKEIKFIENRVNVNFDYNPKIVGFNEVTGKTSPQVLSAGLVYIPENYNINLPLEIIIRHELSHSLQWQKNKKVADVFFNRIFKNAYPELFQAAYIEGFAKYLQRDDMDNPNFPYLNSNVNLLKFLEDESPNQGLRGNAGDCLYRGYCGSSIFFIAMEKAKGRDHTIHYGLNELPESKEEYENVFLESWKKI